LVKHEDEDYLLKVLHLKPSDSSIYNAFALGFVGRLGKKNWSTPIFDEMMKTLKGS
jgi:hypothetical protein